MRAMTTLPPLSLYVHLPWCVKKCFYCDFNSHALTGGIPEERYLRALQRDLKADLPLAAGRPLASIFFGGGTPSLLSAGFYQELLDWLAGQIAFADDIEITLEANPGTAEQARFAGYRAAGINRLSLGVQSFNDAHLRVLGRIHTADDARRARAMAAAAGFDNINLDLMYRLPKQTLAQAMADLDEAIALAPTHLSWYELTIEQNTVFFSKPPAQPGDELLDAMETAGHARLAAAGFARYEISAYAQAGRRCRHNLNYWQFGDYLAAGAGAHGKITQADGGILRFHKTRMPNDYMQTENPDRERRRLDADDLPLEFALNVLRLVEGVDASLFAARTGLPLDAIAVPLADLRARGLMRPAPHFACTPLGLRFLNEVQAAF